MSSACAMCGDTQLGYADYWRGLRRCASCGHCIAALDVEQIDLRALYQRDYFFGGDYINYVRDRAVFERHFRDRLKEIARYCPTGDLLEIGCAYGFFLACARAKYRVRGYDLAKEAVAFARAQFGVDAQCADFTQGLTDAPTADLVVMWDTIEHLAYPERVIANAASVLRAGGYLFLTTGDIGSALARLQRARWRMIHPPTHLHYFTRPSITRLLERNGFSVQQIQAVGVRRSVSQVLFGLMALGRRDPPSFYRALADSRFGRFSFVLNTYDIMLVVGQKCEQP